MLLTIINLYGVYKGFLKIKETKNANECFVQSRGIPEGARIFLTVRDLPLEVETDKTVKVNIREIQGALIAQRFDGAWNIIMQGAVRGKLKNVENMKHALWFKLNRSVQKDEREVVRQKEPSEALKNILNEAEKLFSEDVKTEKTSGPMESRAEIKKSPDKNRAFNPFSKTYPDSIWQRKRLYNGFMIEGTVLFAGERLYAQAIPVTIPNDHRNLERMGFTRLIYDDSGRGYMMRMKYVPKDMYRKGHR